MKVGPISFFCMNIFLERSDNPVYLVQNGLFWPVLPIFPRILVSCILYPSLNPMITKETNTTAPTNITTEFITPKSKNNNDDNNKTVIVSINLTTKPPIQNETNLIEYTDDSNYKNITTTYLPNQIWQQQDSHYTC